jgi:hypothetical protein
MATARQVDLTQPILPDQPLIMKATMIDPTAEALFKTPEPAPAMNVYQTEQLAIQKNRERLKAERLARESNI